MDPGGDQPYLSRQYPEAVAGANRDHWILGDQWHPEKTYGNDEFSRKNFEHFLAHCRAV
jgi:gamma-glutamyl-gamma-aminobutyrate hydrolase PuuD